MASWLLAGLGWVCVLAIVSASYTLIAGPPDEYHGHIYLILGFPVVVGLAAVFFWLSRMLRRWSED